MELERTVLPEGSGHSVRFRFPGGSAREAAGEPLALLSLRPAGSLRYQAPGANPLREGFFRGLGIRPGRVVGVELHHSRRVLFLDPPFASAEGEGAFERDGLALAGLDPGALEGDARCEGDGGPEAAPGVDGLVTRDPALLPCVTVADCMPLWLLDRGSGAFGVLHSGWKGTGILAAALRGMGKRFGTEPGRLALILGPAIGPCCYAVPPARAEYFAREFGEEAVERDGASARLDLRKANIALARSLGVGALLSIEACSSCDPRLGSFRREGAAAFTRMVALAGHLPPAPEAGGGGVT